MSILYLTIADRYIEPVLAHEKTCTVRPYDEVVELQTNMPFVVNGSVLYDEQKVPTIQAKTPWYSVARAKSVHDVIDRQGLKHGSESVEELIDTVNSFYDGTYTETSPMVVFPLLEAIPYNQRLE